MIQVQVFSPLESSSFEAQAVFLPGALAPFEVLKDHAPIVSLLAAGELRWRKADGSMESLRIQGGVMQLEKNKMKICLEKI